MKRALALSLLTLMLPGSAFAATTTPTFVARQNVTVGSAALGNAYAVGGTVTLTSPVAGDFSAAGGSIILASKISADALLAGGAIDLRAPVAGDLRALGGRVLLSGPVAGDLVVVGGSITDNAGEEKSGLLVGGSVNLSHGSKGALRVYGNNITLGGTFGGDVRVIAIGSVTLAEGTVIHGALSYEAPEQASVPASAVVDGGIHYTGAFYLPTSQEARAITLAGIGVFLFVKILGSLILVGLLAGLFPHLAKEVADRALSQRPRKVLLMMLLGFGVLVATPILLTLLALTFVGIGVALVVASAYFILLPLSFAYAAVVVGAAFARRFEKREEVLWRDGVLGMLVLALVLFIPFVGFPIVFLLVMFAMGALVSLFYHFAFPHDEKA